jgi:hypothetical protein
MKTIFSPPQLLAAIFTIVFLGASAAFGQATLEAPADAEIGEEVLVKYTGPGTETGQITLGLPGGEPLTGANPANLSGDASGSVNILMPDTPGPYLILYVDGTETLASREIVVTPVTVTLEASPEISPGSQLSVAWKGPGNDGDAIAIRNPAGVAVASSALTDEVESGTVQVSAPAQPGVYDVAYVSGDDILATIPLQVVVGAVVVEPTANPVATAATVNAPAEVEAGYSFEVTWGGPAAPNDRLVLIDPAAPQSALSYSFLTPTSNQAVLRAAAEPGQYQVQYRNGAGEILVSQEIAVTAAPDQLATLVVDAQPQSGFVDDSGVSIILDASGSMLQDQSGKDRIDIAKETLLKFMKESIPEGTAFSLRAFGHIEKGSCESELLIPMAPFDYEGMRPIVEGIEAINLAKTPIADSLEKIPSDMQSAQGPRTVVLLTDGKETCEGDPAAVIQKLRSAGTNVRVNIVGYAIEDEELRRNFESWAAIGDGRYFDAPEPTELATALRGAVAIPYAIYREEQLVATGVTGQTTHRLAPGSYEVAWSIEAEEVRKTFQVADIEMNKVVIP